MEGCWKLLLVGSVLCGLAGCETLRGAKPTPPANTVEPPLSTVSRKPAAQSNEKNNAPPKVETLVAWANVRLQSASMPDRLERDRDQDLKEARGTYQQVLKREPKNVDAMLGLARAYKLMGEKDKCVEWYQQATKIDSKNAAIWGEMGQSLDSLGDREAAIHCYHTASTMDPDNRDFKKALAFALARTGRYDEALVWFNRYMSAASAHICLGRMMDHNGQRDLANQQFTMALKIEPSNEIALMALNNSAMPDASVTQANYEQIIQPTNTEAVRPAAPQSAPRDGKMPLIPSPPAVIRAPDPLPLTISNSPSTPPPLPNSNAWGR
jgi:Tfp pilus assembly protein PilF